MTSPRELTPPSAKRVPVERRQHGDVATDDYAWLADRSNPETIDYLTAENAYTQARTADQTHLQETIFEEIRSRTKETDLSVPIRKDGYWYYARTVRGQQYPIYCRVAAGPDLTPPSTEESNALAGEQVLLDANLAAADSAFFALGAFSVSPSGKLLAYACDHTGDEHFVLHILDLSLDEPVGQPIPDVHYGVAWAGEETLFYLTADAAWRPYRVWRHRLDTAPSADVVVFEEPDERFCVNVSLSRCQQLVMIDTNSKVTSEVHLIPVANPSATPTLVTARREGIEYGVEPDPANQRLLVLHNDGAEDFALAAVPLTDPAKLSAATPLCEASEWAELIGHAEGTRLFGVDAFADHLVISLRQDGLTRLRVVAGSGEQYDIPMPEPIYTVSLTDNPDYHSRMLRLSYASLITPASTYDYDVTDKRLILRKRQSVLGDFDPSAYEQHRCWAVAADGVRVPISLVARRGTPTDGRAPAVLYGYGAYETSVDPWFSIARLSLLDRGYVFAIAHVRGGGELGRRWHESGKMLSKRNTFTDFVACADSLCAAGWTSPDRLIARGDSAGGLLMGAVANLAPRSFAGIIAEVPFVDTLNTMLDPSLPLTTIECDEWGDPLGSARAYTYIKSYAPYENVTSMDYPAILALGSLSDTRVLYHEPAKWIAKLRALAPHGDYLLKTELAAGHGGPSGRYDAWREEAFILAWALSLPSARPPSTS